VGVKDNRANQPCFQILGSKAIMEYEQSRDTKSQVVCMTVCNQNKKVSVTFTKTFVTSPKHRCAPVSTDSVPAVHHGLKKIKH
jgi:hypothetical protein